MDAFWPWLAVAAAGALHGINPVSGWPAVVWRARAHGPTQGRRALGSIAAGHIASMSLVAGSIAAGTAVDRTAMQAVAGALLVAVVAWRNFARPCATSRAGLTLWSFIVSTGHGAGLMLVPALIPLCAAPASQPPTASPLWAALSAIAIHTAAMLSAGGIAAAMVVRIQPALLRRKACVAARASAVAAAIMNCAASNCSASSIGRFTPRVTARSEVETAVGE